MSIMVDVIDRLLERGFIRVSIEECREETGMRAYCVIAYTKEKAQSLVRRCAPNGDHLRVLLSMREDVLLHMYPEKTT